MIKSIILIEKVKETKTNVSTLNIDFGMGWLTNIKKIYGFQAI